MSSPTPPDEPQDRPAGSPAGSPEIATSPLNSPSEQLAEPKNSNNDDGQGGIFSTPELTVETQNLPDPEGQPSEDDKSRIAAVFQKHDRSRQRQTAEAKAAREAELANQARWEQNVAGPHGQNPAAQAMNAAALSMADIPSTATGDIRLPGEKKKSRWKAPLIILLVLLVIGLGGGGWWMMKGRGESEVETKISLSEAKNKFDQYANYLLFGTSSDNELGGSFESDRSYELEDQLDGDDSNYWQTAKNLLEVAVSTYQQIENPDKNLALFLRSYQQSFVFIDIYHGTAELTDEQILARYVDDGFEATNRYIDSHYVTLAGLESEYAKTYAQVKSDQYKAFNNLLNIYNSGGCIKEGILDDACINELYLAQSNEILDKTTTISKSEQTANSIIERVVRQLESDCWRISTQYTSQQDDENVEGNS